MIYVLCPGYFKTGGTELAHQLVYQLKQFEIETEIVYYFGRNCKYEINQDFKKYVSNFLYVNEIIDIEENIVVFPETACKYIAEFRNVKKYVWWMSVDNYLKNNNILDSYRLRGLVKTIVCFLSGEIKNYNKQLVEVDMNLCQSQYSISFLKSLKISPEKIKYLSDYINESYQETKIEEKENFVLYNPKKGYAFTKRIIRRFPNLIWIPIEKMTSEEVKELLAKSKVYIDFGHHPGKDRLPREAAISGCCIITGKKGAAGYDEDLSIPKKYKFDNSIKEIDKIGKMIQECIENYEKNVEEFSRYREIIKEERRKFQKDVYYIFGKKDLEV